jgi:hypothetical protein
LGYIAAKPSPCPRATVVVSKATKTNQRIFRDNPTTVLLGESESLNLMA